MDKQSQVYRILRSVLAATGSHKYYASDLDWEEYIDALDNVLVNVQPFILTHLNECSSDENGKIVKVAPEIWGYTRKALKNECINKRRIIKRLQLVRHSEVDEDFELHAGIPPNVTIEFFDEIKKNNPEQWIEMGLENILYICVINKVLKPKQKLAVDAYISGDSAYIKRTKEIISGSSYYTIIHRLFVKRRFHKMAIKTGAGWLENKLYRKIPKATRAGLIKILDSLTQQYYAAEQPVTV